MKPIGLLATPTRPPRAFPASRIPAGNESFPGTGKSLFLQANVRSRANRSQSQPGTRNPLIHMTFPVPGHSSLKREVCIGNAPLIDRDKPTTTPRRPVMSMVLILETAYIHAKADDP